MKRFFLVLFGILAICGLALAQTYEVRWQKKSTTLFVKPQWTYVTYDWASPNRPLCWIILRFSDERILSITVEQHICTDLGMRLGPKPKERE